MLHRHVAGLLRRLQSVVTGNCAVVRCAPEGLDHKQILDLVAPCCEVRARAVCSSEMTWKGSVWCGRQLRCNQGRLCGGGFWNHEDDAGYHIFAPSALRGLFCLAVGPSKLLSMLATWCLIKRRRGLEATSMSREGLQTYWEVYSQIRGQFPQWPCIVMKRVW